MEFQDYFQCHADYFWEWEDDLEVLAIPGGSTIAYRQYIFEVLENLSQQGLPPFGSLLLAVAATNRTMEDSVSKIEKIVRYSMKAEENDLVINAAKVFLKKLADLPAEYTEGNKRKLLFQTIFESCHCIVAAQSSKKILEVVAKLYATHKGNLLQQFTQKAPFSTNAYQRDFRTIALLNTKFPDTASIIKKMANLPVVEDFPELVPAEKQEVPKDFIQELIDENKTFQVGSLIKSLWAALDIPFHSVFPSDQPLGGISDISNKGNFDRLLISEYANDDIIFLSRLANNEALFLKRETPPVTDKMERVVLIDASLKNWGTPKTIAHSILLAIAKHPKTDMQCAGYAIGNSYTPIKHNTIHDVIDSQLVLDEGLNGAKGLELFFREFKQAKLSEVILISSADALRHPAMQRVISHNQKAFKYWITADADGTIELFKNQANGRKSVQKFQLNLEELWKKEDTRPAIKAVGKIGYNNPLLFPPTFNVKKLMHTSDGETFIVSKDRKVFRFYEKEKKIQTKGMELVLEDLPSAITHYAGGLDNTGHYLFLGFKVQQREIVIYDLNTKESKSVFFNDWRSSEFKEFFFYDNAFHYMTWQDYWVIRLSAEISITKYNAPSDELRAFYNQYEIELAAIWKEYKPVSGVLKKLDMVYINYDRNLVLNQKHELNVDATKRIQISPATKRAVIVSAERDHATKAFHFPDGSSVEVNSSGVLVLKGPQVKSDAFDVVLESGGISGLTVIKWLVSIGKYTLRHAKALVDHAPSTIVYGVSTAVAEKLQRELTAMGAKSKVIKSEQPDLIYIAAVVDSNTAGATYTQFAGNDYYYPSFNAQALQKVDADIFFEKQVNTYIHKVITYGTEAWNLV